MLGVRGAHETLPWPFDPRTAPSSTNNLGGGDYVDSRHALANKYAARWLLALHDQERTLYADMLYELCVDLAQSSLVADDVFLGPRSRELDLVRFFEKLLCTLANRACRQERLLMRDAPYNFSCSCPNTTSLLRCLTTF